MLTCEALIKTLTATDQSTARSIFRRIYLTVADSYPHSFTILQPVNIITFEECVHDNRKIQPPVRLAS